NEFSLLMMLVEKPNEVICRDKLHKSLLKTEYDGLNRSIDNTISRLRKKLGDENISQLKIKSIRGKGYLFSSKEW
ncbi:MAG: winged helix-turn-helix domain-containing protein, partial [Gammaproteobacteria bacterium]